MCGRQSHEMTPQEIARETVTPIEIVNQLALFKKPNFNVAPSDLVPVYVEGQDGRQWREMRWGLRRPGFEGISPSNARAESILHKDVFKGLVQRRRCLQPVSGYYEWRKLPSGRKVPYHIQPIDQDFFWIASIYYARQLDNGTIEESCCMITTEACPQVAEIHHRMPVIMQCREDAELWLSRAETDLRRLMPLLRPFPGDRLHFHPISDRVNNVRNNDPTLLLPRAEPIELNAPRQLALVS